MKKLIENLGWIGLAILVVGLMVYSMENFWSLTAKILTIAGSAVLLAGLALNYQSFMTSLKKRSTLLGAHSLFSVVVFLGILGLINFLGQRHSKRWDLTSQGQFSLSDQTHAVIDSLEEDIQIKAFFEGGEYGPVKDLLVEYRSLSPKISFEFIDPNKKPLLAKEYDVKTFGDFVNPLTGTAAKYGTLIIESPIRKEKIEKNQAPVQEQDLTNAIIKVTRKETKTAYFLTGHNEKGIENQEQAGFSAAKNQLEKENFTVKTVNLVRENGVPADCALLVVAGPETSPFPQELDFIGKYLEQGGAVLFLLDPKPSPGLTDFLQDWGVDVGDNVVVDASGVGRLFGAGPEIPLVTSYGSHPITKKFGRIMTFFPLARSVSAAASPPSGLTVEKILETNPRSWAETGDLSDEISFDEGQDLKGPVTLGVSVTKDIAAVVGEDGKEKEPAKQTRLVVVGDSDFCSNASFGQQGNGDLFMNMANWLAAEEDLITIRPKDPQDKRVVLSNQQEKLLFYISVVILPLAVLLTGVSVWWGRKRL